MEHEKSLAMRMGRAGANARRTMEAKPLVEIYAGQRVLIEHHRGICRFDPEEICVNARGGSILVQGQQLRLARIAPEQLVICGSIACVRFCKGEEA